MLLALILAVLLANGLIDRNIIFGNAKARFMPQHLMIKYLTCQGTGDLETGKAWRLVRRPSDMVCILTSRAILRQGLNFVERVF